MRGSRFRAGDWVRVRPRDEILAGLDENGCLDGMPFQPEMLAYCGRRMQVFKVAHKTCDYSTGGADGRALTRSVHLVDARCDGTAHDVCQAHCYFFWKDEWLEPDSSPATTSDAPRSIPSVTVDRLHELTRCPSEDPKDGPVYLCQTTVLRKATRHLAFWDARQYIDDVTSGNLSVRELAWLLASGILRWCMGIGVGHRYFRRVYDRLQALRQRPPLRSYVGPIPMGSPTPTGHLDLAVGDEVDVRPWSEIQPTLNRRARNRGLKFDHEMAKFCERRYRVEARVERIIDEKTGRMLTMKNPCIQLEGVHCMAECTPDRLGCPRRGRIFWREIWLKRVDG